MKTTIKAKIIIETDKFRDVSDWKTPEMEYKEEMTLDNLKKEIDKGNYQIEWINSNYSHEQEPTIIIKV